MTQLCDTQALGHAGCTSTPCRLVGPYATSRVYACRKVARRAVDRLDAKYGAAAHGLADA